MLNRRLEPEGRASHVPGRTEAARRGLFASASAAILVFTAVGCAPMQRVPLDLGPAPVEVYVDGERLPDPLPAELDLKPDRAHIVFVKKPGYRPEQVVLRSVEQADGPPRLEPEHVALELRRETPKGRRLEVELDDPPPLPGGTAESP
jgi:hypothetical protein